MLKHYTIVMLAGLGIAGLAALGQTPASAAAADVSQEIATAAKHAQLAGNSENVDAVHVHLQHTLNCIEGPKGANFDPKQMNPCKGMGDGAIPDSTDMKVKTELEAAAKEALAGVAEADLAKAQKHARDTEVMLNRIGK
ncbi:hypothetical protein [Parvibaculum sp.]|uniref:hypothetical protein n=1 Tax=Parvibaculum sp. TaxID=2024848 RepID=UPI00320CF637